MSKNEVMSEIIETENLMNECVRELNGVCRRYENQLEAELSRIADLRACLDFEKLELTDDIERMLDIKFENCRNLLEHVEHIQGELTGWETDIRC